MMQAWYLNENPYPFVPQHVLDAADSVRGSLPNKYCDPKLAADLFEEALDEYLLCDDIGINVVSNEHHSGINCLFGASPLILGILARQTKNVRILSLGTLVTVREINGPLFVQRYNLARAAPITGNLATGVSSGDVIKAVDRLSDRSLPRSMKTEWTELMFVQIREGNTTLIVFALAVVCVFLALSALYESWTLPLAVILVVPMCVLSSVIGVQQPSVSAAA